MVDLMVSSPIAMIGLAGIVVFVIVLHACEVIKW